MNTVLISHTHNLPPTQSKNRNRPRFGTWRLGRLPDATWILYPAQPAQWVLGYTWPVKYQNRRRYSLFYPNGETIHALLSITNCTTVRIINLRAGAQRRKITMLYELD